MGRKTKQLSAGGGFAILLASLGLCTNSVHAQSNDGDVLEEVVVTGSRIARDEFSSAAPIQTFNIEAARQIGVNSVSELLQRSTIANGQQLNGELNTNSGNSNASESPAIGGVGSANVSLAAWGRSGPWCWSTVVAWALPGYAARLLSRISICSL